MSDQRQHRNGNTVNIINSGNSYVSVEAEAISRAVANALAAKNKHPMNANNDDEHHLMGLIIDEDGTVQADISDRVLRNGEIGVFFCVSIFVPTPIIRLRDINLRTGQFARLRCGLDRLDVFCERRQDQFPVEERRLFPGEFIVVTCNR
ncbi:hypothetical protein EV207_13913 [Scopulibacillus darangshiensis]|uniref:Uncharacterized protein n=1 Tax=Scopulibacillus darangshiensis TaxID=442528 RepID=A0A4R2NK92_9BACL|nr:hypothetical protein [Scopulibacillus darangshiensis]TCP21871.1 hypothetical protein EV207_13913 [Scopulibacillus darangshiensis]